MDPIRKSNGTTEAFDPEKVERSLRAAGADEGTAEEVARSIGPAGARTTRELRHEVSARLHERDEGVASRYDGSRTAIAHAAGEVRRGEVCLPEDMAQRMMLWSDDLVELRFAGRSMMARVDRCNPGTREVYINPDQMRDLGATEGSKVVVTKAAAGECPANM